MSLLRCPVCRGAALPISFYKETQLKKDLSAWGLIIPSIILFTFFLWYPLLYGVVLSFSEVKGFSITGFAGLENYRRLFKLPVFWKAMQNSFSYTAWSLVIGFMVPIITAIIISELIHFSSVYRVAMYFPTIVPIIATTLMWRFMMDPGQGGLFNAFFIKLGLQPFGWLQESAFTIPLIVITMTWKSAGATTIIYIARIKGINQNLYEAAALDGASIWQRIRHVTLPQVFNLARLLLILQVLSVFQVLLEPMMMTSGGPNNASISLLLLNWQTAFVNFRLGQAGAIGVIVSIILIILTVINMKITKENEVN